MMKQVFLLVTVVAMTRAYPEGAPVDSHPEICKSMFPSGHNDTAQTGPAPYTITADANDCCSEGESVNVVVKSKQTEAVDPKGYFEGVFIQARIKGMEDIIGTFSVKANSKLKTAKCNNDSDVATQSDKAHYFEKEFTWHPPSDWEGEAEFVATIVHETEKFWVMQKSSSFKVNRKTSGADVLRVQPVLLFGLLTFILAAVFQ